MSAKVPNTGNTIRDQWPNQRMRGRSGMRSTYQNQAAQNQHAGASHFAPQVTQPADLSSSQAQAPAVKKSKVGQHQGQSRFTSEYSRHNAATRYVSVAAQNRPVEVSWVPFIAYAVVFVLLTILWFAWVKASVDGSVMDSSPQFMVGFALLPIAVVVAIALAVAMIVRTSSASEASRVDITALCLGKAAAGLFVFVAIWFAAMLLSA